VTDLFSKEKRREIMQAIKGRDSKPEIKVRKVVHSLGFRFRLHRKDLPGTPDLVFPSRKLCIFIHGCFWHRHLGCARTSTPKTNKDFWLAKFHKNVIRDAQVKRQLEMKGWSVVIIWECETKNIDMLTEKLLHVLSDSTYYFTGKKSKVT